jgi:hypothetical protein
VEDRHVRLVAEADPREVERGGGPVGDLTELAVVDVVGDLEHLLDPSPAGGRVREVPHQVADQPDRHRQQGQQVGHPDELAGGQLPGGDARGPDDQHDHRADRRQPLGQRAVAGPDPADGDQLVAQVQGGRGEATGLHRLPAERLDGQGTVEGLVRHLGDPPTAALRLLHRPEGQPRPADVDADHDDEQEHRQATRATGRSA